MSHGNHVAKRRRCTARSVHAASWKPGRVFFFPCGQYSQAERSHNLVLKLLPGQKKLQLQRSHSGATSGGRYYSRHLGFCDGNATSAKSYFSRHITRLWATCLRHMCLDSEFRLPAYGEVQRYGHAVHRAEVGRLDLTSFSTPDQHSRHFD
jgi:hypothetical protein